MFSKSFVSFVLLAVLSSGAQARLRIVERDGRALYGRRFGQENPQVISDLSGACDGAVCGNLAGQAVSTLLAASPECAQQDLADKIIDAARLQDATTGAKMIALAKVFRQAEKNTPPDFTTNPPTPRNSVFCQTAPRNAELVGLNQAQDPANGPDDFFDPACKCTVKKGSQANTSPLAGGATSAGNSTTPNAEAVVSETATSTSVAATETATSVAATETATATDVATTTATDATATTTAAPDASATCPAVATVTVTVDPAAATTTAAAATSTDAAASATETASAASSTDSAAASATTTAAAAAATGALPAGVDLGSCTDPTIKFGAGIEGRVETSFIPNNTKDFAHGSAQNSAIITQFICDTFVNSCKANQAAVDLCATAKTASAAAGLKKGAAADAFNKAFGVTTNFASVQALDDQGKAVV